jgi:hypothetical protein
MAIIADLLCGSQHREGIAKTALDQLEKSIEIFADRALRYLNNPTSEDSLTFGPFCARVILENGCAALVGRIDAFRMLYLSEFQAQSDYEPGRRAKSAFSWTGDVIPNDKALQQLWSIDHDIPKLSRALFSQHSDHMYWKPAFESLLDFISSQDLPPELSDIVAIDPNKYTESVKGLGQQLYSTLSKGVHWEFFTSSIMFDEATVKTVIRDSCLLVANVGLTSHFIPTAYSRLSPADAVSAYVAFRRTIK